jgi:hypothetical protein
VQISPTLPVGEYAVLKDAPAILSSGEHCEGPNGMSLDLDRWTDPVGFGSAPQSHSDL